MDPIFLARIQFASTTIFHYLFVPMSIGLALTIAIMQTIYHRTGDEKYKKMTKFWGTMFLINFAVGVVTGILQEFQFGMNWSTYSRFVGDVFGPSLAIEGLLAFFMESTFIGLWVFGWDRLPRRVHLLSIWLVLFGTVLSAFWILTANSFMHHPVGFEYFEGRAQMNDFLALLTNPQLWVQFPHVLFSAFATGAFFVAGISAWKILKKQQLDMFKKSFQISIIIATVSTVVVLFVGHQQAVHLLTTQPMKMAAAEALWEDSADPAPFTVVAKIDPYEKTTTNEIQIPYMLSVLSFNKFSGQVEGMNTIQKHYEEKYGPGNYIPPVRTVFWSFRTMVFAGTIMLLLGVYGWYVSRRNRLEQSPLLMKVMVYAIALPFIGNTVGWLMTEMGRQPWVVFGVMKTEDAVSPNVTAGQVLFSLISFSTLYAILAGVAVYLYVRTIKQGAYQEKTVAVDADADVVDPSGREDDYIWN
ncbi:cytochrome ubiquinol oxidase subunit I [Sporosarcina luteola]|uniref:cytochrome ubiquinol oxidase subunit I n=1 Tax=Sporosarcina luteola TaxID=582850 RepID=UPI0020415DFB|nr:cytochrome ubiquinol oxidase subunit I [Sporosarcina luteola]MCM3745407.1 cytochrome ubiquinol oxidase subunit I [Sporosarcina luteola]